LEASEQPANIPNQTGAVLITISEFAKRIMASYRTAYEIAHRRDLWESGIAINLSQNKRQKSIRIDWQEYLKYVKIVRPTNITYCESNAKKTIYVL
jgi:hypothetical protein